MSNDAAEKKSYRDTLNLPTTTLSIRASSATREPEILKLWQDLNIEAAFFKKKHTPYVLHDGPPYANGKTHIGHALNKILKDIVIRSMRMMGRSVSFVPGWDCHGLPIELKVAAEAGNAEKGGADFKKACRAYVEKWKDVQQEEFRRLGVFAEWNDRYMTMDPAYEAEIIRSFARFVEQGYIERKGKTVPWCFSCKTVLATAEIEYADRKDPSCFILFPVRGKIITKTPITGTLSFLVWTTTPWTIPLNRAVVLHPDAEYAVVQIDADRAVVCGADLVPSLTRVLGAQPVIIDRIHSSQLIGLQAQHPLIDDFTVPVLGDTMVSVSDGTACLHSAPGCGPEDYLFGVKNGLEIFSPLSADGRYTAGIMPSTLEHMPITEGQWWVLRTLNERGTLLHKETITHSYPHCWRCQNGLMFRATEQWFCNLANNDLVARTQSALNDIAFIPAWGKTRLDSFLSHRSEWCISRQRRWGVPIPVLYNTENNTHILDSRFIIAVADQVQTAGIEWWDTVSIADLRTAGLLPESLCNTPDAHIKKEMDTLDVWFDSGVSHTAAMKARNIALPVDLYLEGSDQHRGWFQSSLLSSMILNDAPQTKAILTHGFVVDAQGLKMSKSRGNVVDPREVIEKHGADVLRLWVSSVDYERDVALSLSLLEQTAEAYRKIRNTCRFLIANLYDFNPESDAVTLDELLLLDSYALTQVIALHNQVEKLYKTYSYPLIVQAVVRYCTVSLSAHYLDMSKDRLYCNAQKNLGRRSAQTAQYHILHTLLRLLAPLMPFTADDIYLHLPYQKPQQSVHLERFSVPQVTCPVSEEEWGALHEIREEVMRAIERLREQGVIKQSLEASVEIVVPNFSVMKMAILAILNTHRGSPFHPEETLHAVLQEWFIVSRVSVAVHSDRNAKLQVTVAQAGGTKCPRCWRWFKGEGVLCQRCHVGFYGG